ncbi:MAG: hypothetical protein SOZ00_01560 [Tidjanibacter sp.]|nr:hypothetical protein [Tidjanibacter sp.]
MKTRLYFTLLFVLAIAGAEAQPRLRIAAGAGLYTVESNKLTGHSYSPSFSLSAEYRALDFGTQGHLYAGVDLKYMRSTWERVSTSDPSQTTRDIDNLCYWAVRSAFAYDLWGGAAQLYAGGAAGIRTDRQDYDKTAGATVSTNFKKLELYGRGFVGARVRLLPWLGVFAEAGAPVHSILGGVSVDF